MYRRYYKSWNSFEITKREIIASISIIATMLIIGVLISNVISNYIMDKNEKYNKAIHVTDTELFQYGIDTNVGNAFVYGDLKAIDTVSHNDVKGEYLYLERVKEIYTMHTRTKKVGKSYVTETYWTWDWAGNEELKAKKVNFLGIEFDFNKFNPPSTTYIDTVKESSHVRYKYYGYPTESKGTICANLNKENLLGDSKVDFTQNKTIEETLSDYENSWLLIIFWCIWIFIIGIVVYGFYYLDNNWLN